MGSLNLSLVKIVWCIVHVTKLACSSLPHPPIAGMEAKLESREKEAATQAASLQEALEKVSVYILESTLSCKHAFITMYVCVCADKLTSWQTPTTSSCRSLLT